MNDQLIPKRITKIIYNCIILIVAIIVIIRWISAFNNDIVVINEEINSHISNFALSLVFYVGVGYTMILQRNGFRKIILLGLCIIIANIICETIIGFLNTTDLIDAIYGIAGTFAGYCFLFLAHKYGLESIHTES